jgi:hypothetical protein
VATLEQLRRELARIKSERDRDSRRMKAQIEVREDFAKRNAERNMLKKQLFVLKHPKLAKAASRGIAVGKSGFMALVSAAKQYHKYQQKKKRR